MNSIKLFLYPAIITVLLLTKNLSFGQEEKRKCFTTEKHLQLMEQHPEFKANRETLERLSTFRQSQGNQRTQAVITIPIVVHVLYHSAQENISDAQIQSQIDVLNEDFRRLNADASNTPSVFAAVAADAEIQFCLAQRTPGGAPSTGITRTYTTLSTFDAEDSNEPMKFSSLGGIDAWDRNKYLNIWVCNLIGGVLGYAQFPGGPANTDGVVIRYKSFGRTGTVSSPYHLGRTATHEVGHWLDLIHIWGDSDCGDDAVSDTPTQLEDNSGCPSFPHVSTCPNNSNNAPNGDMFMNYMDYVNDNCMNMFSQGQKTKMTNALTGTRTSLQTSNGCSGTGSICGTTTFTSQGKTFTDGSGSNNYTDNLDCQWLIQPSSATSIKLYFTAFNTESVNDVVTVYDGATTSDPVLGTFSGSTIPSEITSSGGSLLVRFTTNASTTAAGWTAGYYVPQSIYPTCFNQYVGMSGTITDGPGNYANNLYCSYLIKPTGASFVTLQFSQFNTESTYDYLFVYDGENPIKANTLGIYTGTSLPANVTSNTGVMLVEFISDAAINAAGFTASWSSDGTVLGTTHNQLSENIKIYPNPANEVFIIEGQLNSSNNSNIKILNTLGQTVMEENIQGFDLYKTISTQSIGKGTYFLILESGTEQYRQKIVLY